MITCCHCVANIVSTRIIHVGSNNLRPDRSFQPRDKQNYKLLLRALLAISSCIAKILAGSIFKRKDISDALVQDANMQIKSAVDEVSGEGGGSKPETVSFLEQPAILSKRHLIDHGHLNKEGYRIWDRVLSEKVRERTNNIENEYLVFVLASFHTFNTNA